MKTLFISVEKLREEYFLLPLFTIKFYSMEGDQSVKIKVLKASSKKNYGKKRKFHGNRFTSRKKIVLEREGDTTTTTTTTGSNPIDNPSTDDNARTNEPAAMPSVSARKVKQFHAREHTGNHQAEPVEGYRLVDMTILGNVFKSLSCPECFSDNLFFEERLKKKSGFSSFLSVSCKNCPFSRNFTTSKRCAPERGFDVNR